MALGTSRRRTGVGTRVLVALTAALASGCQFSAGASRQGGPPLTYTSPHSLGGYASESDTTQMVTTKVGGKNVFIPSTVVVAGGRPHALSIYNTTDAPHGFQIEALGVEVVLEPQQETQVQLPAMDRGTLEGRKIYRIGCQLHPPHRTATLVILPGS